MSDALITEVYEAQYDTCYADAHYSGALALVEQGAGNVNVALNKEAGVTVYDCRGDLKLSLSANESLTLQIAATPTEVKVQFNLSTVVEVNYVDCNGQAQTFSGTLAISGDFTFKPGSWSCADLQRCCSSGGFSSMPAGAFNLNLVTTFVVQDGTDMGAGVLTLENNKVTLFDWLVEGRGSISGDEAIDFGTYVLTSILAPERSSDPFEGFGGEDDDVLRAIGDGAQAMIANPSATSAQNATLGATWGGMELVFDYTAKALAVAAVAPTDLALASSTDGGLKGDGLTNVRQVKIDGVTSKYATVQIYDGDKLVGTGKADGAGVFHVTTSSLSDGVHTLTARATDGAGISGASQELQVTIDTQGPAAPVLASVGPAGVAGTAAAGETVQVYDGAKLIGSAVAGADGRWSLDTALNAKTVHAITAATGDAAGNVAQSNDMLFGSMYGKLTGTSGSDILVATPGATLTGGYGSDLFVFEADWGKATIADFRAGADDIRISHATVDTWTELKAAAKQVGYDVVITLDATHSITLKSVALSSLSSGDFLFG